MRLRRIVLRQWCEFSLLWAFSWIALSLHKAERACLTSTGRGTAQTQGWARWRQRWQRRWLARDYSRGPSSLGALQKTQQKEGEIRSACHCTYLIKHAEKSQLINSLNCYAFFRILRTPVLTVSVPYKAFLNGRNKLFDLLSVPWGKREKAVWHI